MLERRVSITIGEHERGVRVAQGAAESNSSLLSALQTSQVLNISTYAQLPHELIVKLHLSSLCVMNFLLAA